MKVLKSLIGGRFAIELAQSDKQVTLIHSLGGPFVIENFTATREFMAGWMDCDKTPKDVATSWLHNPCGIATRASDAALAAIIAISKGKPVESAKLVETDKQIARSGKPSSVAREILKRHDLTQKTCAKAFYDECEAAGIDRKLAASVLCIERKKLAAPPKRIVVKKKKGRR